MNMSSENKRIRKSGLKKALLATSLSGALIVSAGMGTYSWFTSETNAHGELKGGMLELNNGTDIEQPLFDEKQFSPSQLQYGSWVSLSNTGDLDAHLKAIYNHSIDKASLDAYEVGYMAMKYTVKPDQDAYKDSKIALDNLFNGVTNERSVMKSLPNDIEVSGKIVTQKDADSGEIVLGEGSEDSFWEVEEGQYIDLMIAVKLDESAGNDYQGARYNASLNVIAKQTDDGAKYE
ncbi:hypothetical protein [Virgibacillus halodenitrificans]|uniref:hypothetical protein n=2 Tax=Virgibacillus halodenitrificans TaxID=1482 RepID=UPI0007611E1E